MFRTILNHTRHEMSLKSLMNNIKSPSLSDKLFAGTIYGAERLSPRSEFYLEEETD